MAYAAASPPRTRNTVEPVQPVPKPYEQTSASRQSTPYEDYQASKASASQTAAQASAPVMGTQGVAPVAANQGQQARAYAARESANPAPSEAVQSQRADFRAKLMTRIDGPSAASQNQGAAAAEYAKAQQASVQASAKQLDYSY
ncbi:hypothetical protein [Pseudooceanicola sp.]|uniref:hypothetical protein n=1 Tax=Pseudooceanicola sp. TaxID=1914328 RepID=UPI0026063EED|nr:hypothetical protein [Pseudooceanicola sp.]MDF1854172.1 hypothetical protein [Pseudooceanicola sp.]